MSVKLNWEQLVSHAISYEEVLQKLKEIKKGSYKVFHRSVCKGQSVDTTGATTVDGLDHFDDGCPVDTTLGWLTKSDFETGRWVVVPSSIFNESTPPQPIQTQLTKSGSPTMSQLTRRTVTVQIFDNDAGLDVAHSLVAQYDNVVTEDDDATTIREVLMNHQVDRKLKAHNALRSAQIDLDIQKRTGNTVMLTPVKLKDLTWFVKA